MNKMKKGLSLLTQRYFDKDLDLNVQIFHLLAFAGMAAGVAAAVFGLIINAGAANFIVNLSASALAFFLLHFARRTNRYHFCYLLTVVAVFMMAFPILFFIAGGYHSGMPCFFVFAALFTALMLNGAERAIAVTAELIIYTVSCLIAYRYPASVNYLDTEWDFMVDVIFAVVVSCGLLLSAILLYIRLYNNKQALLREANKELDKRAETLMRLDRMKTEFLATVSHEMKTPLQIITGNAHDTIEMLEEEPLNLEEILENQRRISQVVKRIDGIIVQLLDTTAIENGRLALHRFPVDLSVLLRSITDSHFPALNKNGNHIRYDLEAGLPPLWADKDRVEQVLVNLLSNATRHTENGVVTVSLKGRGGKQIVGVSDTGEGMPPQILQQALKGYIQPGQPGDWRGGMGLYICKQIVAAHGGDIWIESETGNGTAVYFSLNQE